METDKKNVKMVPEYQLIEYKKAAEHREKQAKERESQLSQAVARLENELKIAKANGDDSEEVQLVRQHLLTQNKELDEKRTKHEQDSATLTDRERKARARELVIELKSKGVETDIDALLGAEDMDRHSKDLLVEFLAKENERLKAQPSPNAPESVFDMGSGGVVRKSVKDIDVKTPEGRKQLADFERQLVHAK